MRQYVISTDLDGTLLDHATYSTEEALPAISRCQEYEIPIIFNTSKNQTEAAELQRYLGIEDPMIVENGSALVSLRREQGDVIFGVARSELLDFLDDYQAKAGKLLSNLEQWSLAEIIERTGLKAKAAAQMQEKRYSEPFVWQGTQQQLQAFEDAVVDADYSLSRGGRFFHLQGHTDKSKPLQYLQEDMSILFDDNREACLICLGDSYNDVAMLSVADIAVWINSADPPPEACDRSTAEHVLLTKATGPRGWSEALTQIFDTESSTDFHTS